MKVSSKVAVFSKILILGCVISSKLSSSRQSSTHTGLEGKRRLGMYENISSTTQQTRASIKPTSFATHFLLILVMLISDRPLASKF